MGPMAAASPPTGCVGCRCVLDHSLVSKRAACFPRTQQALPEVTLPGCLCGSGLTKLHALQEALALEGEKRKPKAQAQARPATAL